MEAKVADSTPCWECGLRLRGQGMGHPRYSLSSACPPHPTHACSPQARAQCLCGKISGVRYMQQMELARSCWPPAEGPCTVTHLFLTVSPSLSLTSCVAEDDLGVIGPSQETQLPVT